MSTLLTIGATLFSNPVMGAASSALTPDLYDNFGTVELLAGHVASPLPALAPPAWSNEGVNVVTINASGEVVHSSGGAYVSYIIDAAAPIRRMELETKCGVGGDTGFIIRMDAAATTGIYFVITNNIALNKIDVRPYNWSDVPLAAAQSFTSQQLTTYRKITVTDDGTDIVVSLDNNTATAITFASITDYNTQQYGGIYSQTTANLTSWKDFKMWVDVPSTLSAANYPSVVSAFPITPSLTTNGTDHTDSYITDAMSGLTIPLSAAAPALATTDYTVDYSGAGNWWFFNFKETNAAVKAALDGPSSTAPIIFIVSGRWKSGGEAYGNSVGYGDWQGSTEYIYVGAGPDPQSGGTGVDMEGPVRIGGTLLQPSYDDALDDIDSGVYWYTHLVIVSPATSSVTFKTIRENVAGIQTQTATGAAFTQAFTFSATGTNLTVHQCHLAFMSLVYPDVVPTDDEANGILLYHYRKHRAKSKILHPWFDGRAKAT